MRFECCIVSNGASNRIEIKNGFVGHNVSVVVSGNAQRLIVDRLQLARIALALACIDAVRSVESNSRLIPANRPQNLFPA
jgi:hypothetical protein